MLAAVRAVRPRAREVVVAVPVAAQSTCNDLRHEADHVICARSPWPFYSVGSFYRNFEQTTDAEVCSLLSNASANNDRLTGALREVVKS
jgi:predicted phosphoribosyltransferase